MERGRRHGRYLEFLTTNSTGLVAESHVADLSTQLKRSVQNTDHGVETVSNQSSLFVESGVGSQISERNIFESVELGLESGILGERAKNI